MKEKLKKLTLPFLFSLSIAALLLRHQPPVLAANLSITCYQKKPCQASSASPLFPPSEVWSPGKTVSKTVKITNKTNKKQKIAIQGMAKSDSDQEKIFNRVISLSVINKDNNQSLWQGKLTDLYSSQEIPLLSIAKDSSKELILRLTMDKSADNRFQKNQTSLDLIFGFIENSPLTPPPKNNLFLKQKSLNPSPQPFISKHQPQKRPPAQGEVKGVKTNEKTGLAIWKYLLMAGIPFFFLIYLFFRKKISDR